MSGTAWLAGAWALLVYLNALHAQPPSWSLAASFGRLHGGGFTGAGFAAAQARNAAALGALALYDGLAWAAGRVLLRGLGAPRLRGVTGHGSAFLLGSGAAGLAGFAAALAGLASPTLAAILALAAGIPAWRELGRTGARNARREAASRLRNIPRLLMLVAAVTSLGALAGALAPEVILDATRFFLEIPRRALLLHKLVPLEGHPLSFLPLLPQAVALPLFALAGETPVKLLSWQAGLLVAALVHEWLGEDRRAAALAPYAAVAWLTLLNVPVLAQTAMSDLMVAAWVAFAVRVQFLGRAPLRLAGVLWGGALGCKYQTGAMFLACAAGTAAAGGPWIRLLLPAAAVAAVWPLRNALSAGWPLYPLAVPGALAGSVHSPMGFFILPEQWAAGRTAGAVLAAPFHLATTMTFWDGLLSPLLVVLLPLAFTGASMLGVRIGLAGSLFTWAWAFGSIGRYLLPIVPVLLVEAFRGGARWLAALGRPASDAGRGGAVRLGVLRLLLVAALGYDAVVSFGWAARLGDPATVVLGGEPRAAYTGRWLKPAPATRAMGERLHAGFTPVTRYYVAGALRAWTWPGLAWFDGEFVSSNLARWAGAASDPGRLRVAFRQRGIRHVVAYEQAARGLGYLAPGRVGWTPRARAVARAFLNRYAEFLDRRGDAAGSYALYALRDRPAPRRPGAPPFPGMID